MLEAKWEGLEKGFGGRREGLWTMMSEEGVEGLFCREVEKFFRAQSEDDVLRWIPLLTSLFPPVAQKSFKFRTCFCHSCPFHC